jgi:FkbM family methyltransferase
MSEAGSGLKRRFGSHVAVPMARAWCRYGPGRAGKRWLFDRLAHVPHDYAVRTRFGAALTGNTADFIQRFVYYFGVWEPHVSALFARLRPGDVAIDVGANVGYYTLLASRLVGPGGRVVAVEACPPIFATLERHVRLNGATNVRLVPAAALAADGHVEIHVPAAVNLGATSVLRPENGAVAATHRVVGRPLADLVHPDELRRTRLVKIDTEGAELEVLRGFDRAFDALPPQVEFLVEVSPERLARLGASAAELHAFMLDRGFHGYAVPNSYDAGEYLADTGPVAPRRLEACPEVQTDVVYSRVDAARL